MTPADPKLDARASETVPIDLSPAVEAAPNQSKEWRWWELQPTRRLQARKLRNPRCRQCDYPLRTDAIVGECPECGLSYDKGTGVGITHDDQQPYNFVADESPWRVLWRFASWGLLAAWFFGMILIFAGWLWMFLSIGLAAGCAALWLYATDRITFARMAHDTMDDEQPAASD